jgi:hypothetical protein
VNNFSSFKKKMSIRACGCSSNCIGHIQANPLLWGYNVYCPKSHHVGSSIDADTLLQLNVPYPPHGINAHGGGWTLPATPVYERPVNENRWDVFLTDEELKRGGFVCFECRVLK